MQRIAVTPRAGWREHVERDLGFTFHTIDGAPYWDETACYGFTAAEIDALEDATGELEQMCLALVDRVVKSGDEAYRTPAHPGGRPGRRSSGAGTWRNKNLYGRFDLRFDGKRSAQAARIQRRYADRVVRGGGRAVGLAAGDVARARPVQLHP